MEAENQQLKQALTQKTSQVKTLESRLTGTQLDLQDSQEKVRSCLTMRKLFWLLISPSLTKISIKLILQFCVNCLGIVSRATESPLRHDSAGKNVRGAGASAWQ